MSSPLCCLCLSSPSESFCFKSWQARQGLQNKNSIIKYCTYVSGFQTFLTCGSLHLLVYWPRLPISSTIGWLVAWKQRFNGSCLVASFLRQVRDIIVPTQFGDVCCFQSMRSCHTVLQLSMHWLVFLLVYHTRLEMKQVCWTMQPLCLSKTCGPPVALQIYHVHPWLVLTAALLQN